MGQIEKGGGHSACMGQTQRAFLIAPLFSLAIIYIGTAVYLRFARLLVAPFAWLFATVYGLPVLYVAELFIAIPFHRQLERLHRTSLIFYVGAGIVTSLIATLIWSEVIRMGPIPLYRNFFETLLLTMPAGAVGGATFWRMAVRSPE
jgi:hypothetical protein